MEKQILTDEIQDPGFLTFAIENYSKMFGYIVKGQLNIRIHKEDGPPNNPSGKPARRAVWRARCGLGRIIVFSYYIDFKIIFVRLFATLLNRFRFVSLTIFVF